MHACMYVCMYVGLVCMYVCMYVSRPSMHAACRPSMWSDSPGGRASDCRSMGRWFEPHLW